MTAQEIYKHANETGNKFFFPEDVNCTIFDANCYEGWESDYIECYDYRSGLLVKTLTKDQFLAQYGNIQTFKDALENRPRFDCCTSKTK